MLRNLPPFANFFSSLFPLRFIRFLDYLPVSVYRIFLTSVDVTPPARFPLLRRLARAFSINAHAVLTFFDGDWRVKVPRKSTWEPVYAFVKLIPRGRVITYGGLAQALRLRGGARSAGRAMAASPSGKGIPWHRVVGFGGKLLIREPYASLQRKLLESEGVELTERRVNMKVHSWKPANKTATRNSSARKSRAKSL